MLDTVCVVACPKTLIVMRKEFIGLKTHIRDKCVCGTKTNSSSPIPKSFCCAISLNADWASPTGKHIIWMVASVLPVTPICVRLPVGPALFALAKWHFLRNWGSHWNVRFRAADSLTVLGVSRRVSVSRHVSRQCLCVSRLVSVSNANVSVSFSVSTGNVSVS